MRKKDLVKLRSEAGSRTATVFEVTAVRQRGGEQQIKAESIHPPKEKLPWSPASSFVPA